MYCQNCGKQLDDKAAVCINCGKYVEGSVDNPVVDADSPSFLVALLCFFVPVLGLILYVVYKNSHPKRARSAAKGGIIGLILTVIVTVLTIALYLGLIIWVFGSEGAAVNI